MAYLVLQVQATLKGSVNECYHKFYAHVSGQDSQSVLQHSLQDYYSFASREGFFYFRAAEFHVRMNFCGFGFVTIRVYSPQFRNIFSEQKKEKKEKQEKNKKKEEKKKEEEEKKEKEEKKNVLKGNNWKLPHGIE